MSEKPKIGFVGVGRMGANMARRLHEVGYPVSIVYDVHAPSAEALSAELGCPVAAKLAEVTAASDVIITVVTNDRAQKRIYTARADNLLAGKTRGKVFINCATVSPKVHRDLEKLCNEKKAHSLEACMASSIPQARQGTLYLMVGGKKAAFRKVEGLFGDLSKDLTYVGEAGKAAEVKALVNMVMNINTAALAEGLGLGKALGLDLEMLMKVFSQTGANSRVLETDGEDMVARDHECYFSCEHAAKDSGIAQGLAKQAKLALPLNDATTAQYERLVDLELGHLDKSGVAELTFPGRTLHPGKKSKKGTSRKKP